MIAFFTYKFINWHERPPFQNHRPDCPIKNAAVSTPVVILVVFD
jgi:hypothetical protein